MKIEVLIVDDERIAREGIRLRLEKMPEFTITGECSNGIKAVSAIKTKKPHLVFLDIQMPGLNGFEVIEKIGIEQMPTVVFVTAYDKYAIRAFAVHAFDYLLKPFDEERFDSTIRRVKNQLLSRDNGTVNRRLTELIEDLKTQQRLVENNLKLSSNVLERIVIKSAGRIFFVNVEEIDWFEAADNYIELHMGRETHLIRETVRNLEERLDPQRFLRIRRSTIVNVERIKELHPHFHGEFAVILKDGTELVSGRRFRKNFGRLLNE